MAQIGCALERYHLAHGDYPDTLAALTPEFIKEVPPDIIGGQPLHYQRVDSEKFLLYSVGWNGTDDSGRASGYPDITHGDWVWHSPAL